MISKERVSVDPSKIEAVVDWLSTKLGVLIALAGYYKRFVEGFSNLLSPLTALTRKNTRHI